MSKYCESIFKTIRWKTREVLVGNIGIGGENPVRIQSMTTSNTRDVDATIEQAIRLKEAGCEIVRVTVQGIKEAEACELIKNGLIKKGYDIPLVADIHFYPPAAMKVVDFVDKVRINPGNFVDKRASFKTIEYDDASYAEELEKIEEKFTPLVLKCKTLKKALRIGTNHGSLSDRIMNRFGDTPKGMIESAFEFARVCRKNDFHDFVFSMKSSNPQVMIHAYRLLVAEMMKLGWNYPLHLGVTEAGEGEDGRVKSAMGMGTLLLDGLGDTIRVSLTEDPWHEIDPCKRLIALAEKKQGKGTIPYEEHYRYFENIQRRPVNFPPTVSLHKNGSVFLSVQEKDLEKDSFYSEIDSEGDLDQPKIGISSPDQLILPLITSKKALNKVKKLEEAGIYSASLGESGKIPWFPLEKIENKFTLTSSFSFPYVILTKGSNPESWPLLRKTEPSYVVLQTSENKIHEARHFFDWMQEEKLKWPVILHAKYTGAEEDIIIQASAELGSLLCDGLGEGIWLECPGKINFIKNLSFAILQAARMRTIKTDFISCPSCGRTLFDLQEVTKKIKARTAHLPGVKIAIMGCIVNGPGEMADADFGYVGSKPGLIDLYVGKQCVEKDIKFAEGDGRLISLIKSHGRWIEP